MINKNNLEKFSKEIDENDEEHIEDSFDILKKNEIEFKSGKESSNNYNSTPIDVLRDYQEFN